MPLKMMWSIFLIEHKITIGCGVLLVDHNARRFTTTPLYTSQKQSRKLIGCWLVPCPQWAINITHNQSVIKPSFQSSAEL